jgi:hypothetical protein
MPRGHGALDFVDVGLGFVDRTADVFAVGFLRINGFDIPATVAPPRPAISSLDRYVVKGKLY